MTPVTIVALVAVAAVGLTTPVVFFARERRLRARLDAFDAERARWDEAAARASLRASSGNVEVAPQRAPVNGRGIE